MTDFETASIVAQYAGVAIGIAQCGLIWHGIRMMRRAADARDRGLENQRDADERRHAEAMAALDKRHAEAMAVLADQRRALETLIAGNREQAAALRTVIERTAPKGSAD